MTSHYMRVTVKGSFENVFESLNAVFGNIYFKKIRKHNDLQAGVILGEEYFFRVNSDAAIFIFLCEKTHEELDIEIISCAGGSGLLGISYAAHSSYVHNVLDHLRRYGCEVTVEEEIEYFGRGSR